jgi:DNA (cytosine-5)-methyltransferase 1
MRAPGRRPQTFKQVSLKKSGGRPWGKYGQQYFYTCPTCGQTAFPGAVPAASAIDSSLPIQRIGDREKPLKRTTRGRIRRGWERVLAEPFAMRVGGTGNPRPLTLPLMTQTARHEAAMVFPNAANTYERTPGNRARDCARAPLDTVHGTLDRAMVIPPMGEVAPRAAGEAPAPTQSTTTRAALVTAAAGSGQLLFGPRTRSGGHGSPPGDLTAASGSAVAEPSGSVAALPDPGAEAPAMVMRNNGDQSGEQTTAASEPIRTLTSGCHQSILIPYYRTGTGSRPARSPAPTIPTKDRLALVVPYTRQGRPRPLDREALPTVATEGPPAVVVTEEDIDNCLYRMLDLHEIAAAMAMGEHTDETSPYLVLGNRRERMAQYGNAVTPPAMQLLVGRHLDALDGP